MYHPPSYVRPGGFEHSNYFNYPTGDIVSRYNISAYSPGNGFRQRGLGTIEGNLILRAVYASFDIGTTIDENPTGSTRGTYLTFRHNLTLHSPGSYAVIYGPKNAAIEQNLFLDGLAIGEYPSIHPVTNVTLQDNIFYRGQLQPAPGHTGSIQGPFLIRRNDFQQPSGGSVLWRPTGGGYTYESNNRFFSTAAQASWFAGETYATYVPSRGSTTQVSYPNPDRDLITYLRSLGASPANADQAIEWFMNGVPGNPGLAGAMNNRLGAWDPRFTSVADINYVRAGFGLPAIS